MAIYCKTPPNPLDKQATREHAEDMPKVKECLQGTSDVRKVEMQRLNALSFDQAQAKYSEVAGLLATENLRSLNQHHNRGMGTPIPLL